jgi:hypothetical protein
MSQEIVCRHEYVRIYQRKLKGIDRRLVSTRAYLPVGFKQTDLGHLSEGSYCFCTKCRARLFPKRTNAEKAAARVSNLQAKAALAAASFNEGISEEMILLEVSAESDLSSDAVEESESEVDKGLDVHVEELELESVDVQDIQAEGVKLLDEDSSDCLSGEEDS